AVRARRLRAERVAEGPERGLVDPGGDVGEGDRGGEGDEEGGEEGGAHRVSAPSSGGWERPGARRRPDTYTAQRAAPTEPSRGVGSALGWAAQSSQRKRQVAQTEQMSAVRSRTPAGTSASERPRPRQDIAS